MAMLFMDGFDYYAVGQMGRKWDSASVGSLTTGIYGSGKALQGGAGATKNLTNITTAFAGFHLFVPSSFASATICRFLDNGTIQVDLRIDTSGHLLFTRNGTALGSVSTNVLSANTWYWLEVKLTVNGSTGIAEVRVNGNSSGWVALSSQNTQATANAYFNQFSIVGAGGTWAFDSVHVWDTTGSINTTYIGEHEILSTLPNSVGTNTNWTRGGSTINANNYQQVNEANADDDTTYVSSNSAGQIDTYGFAAISQASGGIAAIAINSVDRVDDASPHVIHHYVKSSATTAESADIDPSATYNNHQSIWETDPNTVAAWTITNANSAEKGMKLVS